MYHAGEFMSIMLRVQFATYVIYRVEVTIYNIVFINNLETNFINIRPENTKYGEGLWEFHILAKQI